MQTCAHAEYTGTLLHAAEARTKVLDHDGLTVPMLCMDVELDNLLHTHMHLEQFFPVGQHAQAQAAAHRFPKYQRITFRVLLVSVALKGTAAHIYTHNPQEVASNA
jgi:predicted transcriptional regulator YheO